MHAFYRALVSELAGVDVVHNAHDVLKAVSPRLYFAAHFGFLPQIPIGNMLEISFALDGVQPTVAVHLPLMTAAVAPNVRTVRIGGKLRFAMRTFVENLVYVFSAVFAFHEQFVVVLVAILIVHKRLLYALLNFVRGHVFDFFGGHQHRRLGVYSAKNYSEW